MATTPTAESKPQTTSDPKPEATAVPTAKPTSTPKSKSSAKPEPTPKQYSIGFYPNRKYPVKTACYERFTFGGGRAITLYPDQPNILTAEQWDLLQTSPIYPQYAERMVIMAFESDPNGLETLGLDAAIASVKELTSVTELQSVIDTEERPEVKRAAAARIAQLKAPQG